MTTIVSAPEQAFAARKPDDYFEGASRYVEKQTGQVVVNVHAGDCFVSCHGNEVGATVLGSCISVCLHDATAGVGGMNHFLLPMQHGNAEDSARFGAFAIEQLINEILKRGGVRGRMEAKIFGGGQVMESSARIGEQNAVFAEDYLLREGVRLVGRDVGDIWPRKVRFWPASGRALVKKLKREDDFSRVRHEESGYRARLDVAGPQSGNITIF